MSSRLAEVYDSVAVLQFPGQRVEHTGPDLGEDTSTVRAGPWWVVGSVSDGLTSGDGLGALGDGGFALFELVDESVDDQRLEGDVVVDRLDLGPVEQRLGEPDAGVDDLFVELVVRSSRHGLVLLAEIQRFLPNVVNPARPVCGLDHLPHRNLAGLTIEHQYRILYRRFKSSSKSEVRGSRVAFWRRACSIYGSSSEPDRDRLSTVVARRAAA